MVLEVKDKDLTKGREDASGKGESSKSEIEEQNEEWDMDQTEIPPKYGPLPHFDHERLWAHTSVMIGVLCLMYFSGVCEESRLAARKDLLRKRTMDVPCSEDYKTELEKFPGCTPQRCGRLISDKVIESIEGDIVLGLAKRGFSLGGSAGGASILDLHSGALSMGVEFVDVYKLKGAADVFQTVEMAVYREVRMKIQEAIADHFGLNSRYLYLTKPTFFSRLTNAPPKSIHDEYWHPHVDKETYKSFHYTSLLYLSDYERDFEGGRFVFIDIDQINRTVEPRKGRVSMFTSGSENLHYVEKVSSGTRIALTVSFTCDPHQSISDPRFGDY